MIGAARGESASLVALPVERLHEDFFRLRTGVAGEFVQKFVTYRVRLAIVGDIARHLSESEALRIGMVLNDSSHRLLRQKAEEMRPPAPLGDVGAQ